MSREIRRKRRDVERARTEFVRAATKDYDSQVFYPALEAIKNECGKIGHGSQYSHNNGLGWIFMHCSSCGAMLEKIGPGGERIKP